MTEDLRNVEAHETETPIDANQTLVEVVGLLGRFTEDHPWDSQLAQQIIEGRLGTAIQMLIQSHLRGVVLPQGGVNVGRGVELKFGTLELCRTLRDPYDKTVGGRDWPLAPDAWFRNYQGILDQVARLG